MQQVQPLSLHYPRAGAVYAGRLQERFRCYEATLLAELFRRNRRQDAVRTATPPGYAYTSDDVLPPASVDVSGPIMQIAAHPGDGPDFFYATYLHMTTSTDYRSNYHEVVLTDGERGVDGWHPERTRRVRIEEAYAGAEIVGSTLHFLGYPDGSLTALAGQMRLRLVTELARLFGQIQPALLVVHPPKNDHPDHASSFLLTLEALDRHTQAGGRAPTLLIHDVEFGLQQQSIWFSPAFADPLRTYPFHSPDLLVNVSATHQEAQRALHKHKTQMYDPVSGQPKAYADLIDKLAEVRGLQFMQEGTTQVPQGQGFSHVVIPGITSPHNLLPARLPQGSVFRRVHREPLEQWCSEHR